MNAYTIQRLDAGARASLLAHFLALSMADRRLRFGRTIAPSVVAAYVDGMNFARDAILGVLDEKALLVGLAHVAFDADPAEVALSVIHSHRGRGIASALFASAVVQASRRGVLRLFMQFLADNTPILRIAQRYGMDIRMRGGDAEARLDVPAQHRKQIGPLAEILSLH
jgi:GNAT superfamily N-acetyltransferase